jgi:hypothetical protein
VVVVAAGAVGARHEAAQPARGTVQLPTTARATARLSASAPTTSPGRSSAALTATRAVRVTAPVTSAGGTQPVAELTQPSTGHSLSQVGPVRSTQPASRVQTPPSPVARTAAAAFTLTCPVATTLTATGTGAGSNALSLTGPGVHRTGAGRRVSFTVQVQPGSYTATDTDTGGQSTVGLRQSVPAAQACHA